MLLAGSTGRDSLRELLERVAQLLQSVLPGQAARDLVDARAQHGELLYLLGERNDARPCRRGLTGDGGHAFAQLVHRLGFGNGTDCERGELGPQALERVRRHGSGGDLFHARLQGRQIVRGDDGRRQLTDSRPESSEIVCRDRTRGQLLDGGTQGGKLLLRRRRPAGERRHLGSQVGEVVRRRLAGERRDLRPQLVQYLRRGRPRGDLVEPGLQRRQVVGRDGARLHRFDGGTQFGDPCVERLLEAHGGNDLAEPALDGVEACRRLLHPCSQLLQGSAERLDLLRLDARRRPGDPLLDGGDRRPHVVGEQPQILVPRGRGGRVLDGPHPLRELLDGAMQVGRPLSGGRRSSGDAVLPRLRLDGLRRPQLLQGRPLLGERAREIEPRETSLLDEHLAQTRAGLALHVERPVEVVGGDETSREEDLADGAAQLWLDRNRVRLRLPCRRRCRSGSGRGGRRGLVVARRSVALELRPLLGEHARELEARDAEFRHDDLAQALAGLRLLLERELELFLRDEALLDEEGADQARRDGRGCFHIASIGRHSFEV